MMDADSRDSDTSTRTMAFEASKRTRNRNKIDGKKSRTVSPRSLSPSEGEDEPTTEPRGGGRPPTTGKGVLCRETKRSGNVRRRRAN